MGASAAAIILIKERHIMERMQQLGAVTPENALSMDEIGAQAHGVGWRRLRDHEAVRESAPGSGRFYADVPVYEALRRMRRRIALVMGLIVLALALGVFAASVATR